MGFITYKVEGPEDELIRVIVLVNRDKLAQLSAKEIGRELTVDELDNLEVQIESQVVTMVSDMYYLSKEWIEEAIVNDDIPA